MYHKDLKKQGDLRNSLVLLGVTQLWHVAQWVSRAPPHHTLPAFLNLYGTRRVIDPFKFWSLWTVCHIFWKIDLGRFPEPCSHNNNFSPFLPVGQPVQVRPVIFILAHLGLVLRYLWISMFRHLFKVTQSFYSTTQGREIVKLWTFHPQQEMEVQGLAENLTTTHFYELILMWIIDRLRIKTKTFNYIVISSFQVAADNWRI